MLKFRAETFKDYSAFCATHTKACAVNDIAATDGSNVAICRDQIQVCGTSFGMTSATRVASSPTPSPR